jgi:hypothetical protein
MLKIGEIMSCSVKKSEKLIKEIKLRARQFADDNYDNYRAEDIRNVESAMLIGASIAHEINAECEKEDRNSEKDSDTFPESLFLI